MQPPRTPFHHFTWQLSTPPLANPKPLRNPMGRWAVSAMRWKLNNGILRQNRNRWDWDRGWLQLRAREEAAKLWVRAGVHGLGIACWQVRGCVGRRARAVRIVGRIVVLLPYVDAGTIERT